MSNYEIVEIGGIDAWAAFTEPAPGKRFVDKEMAAQFVGLSANSLEPGGEAPFWHDHSVIEEVYVFLTGRGQLALDDDVVDVQAGSVVRVGPGVWRAWRSAPDGTEPLTWLCIRGGGGALGEIGNDGELDQERPMPWAG